MKIQTKTTILFTLITAAIFLILNITVYVFLDEFAHRDFNKRLELRARISAKFRFEKDELSTIAFSEIHRQYLERLPEEQAYIIPVDTVFEKPLGEVPKLLPASYIKDIVDGNGNTVFYQNRFRHFAGLLYKDETGHFLVIKSSTNKYGSEMMRQLRIIKLITFICAVVLIYSVGLYFSRKTFQPIRDIISRVKEISKGNLHLRLIQPEGSDEIAELTKTFNQMLNSLETSFETQNNFISNASHELRTPLTAIIGEADYALGKERAGEEYKHSLKQIILQAEKLQELTKGLLALAQTGFDGKKQVWKTVRLDQLLFDVKENCDAILPGNNIQVRVDRLPADEERISIQGNYDLLKIAISNITLNACKYSDNQRVDLSLHLEKDCFVLKVKDRGIGIPDDELKYIYDPFFRASNTRDYQGYGIGMPLANNIIRLHNGEIKVSSMQGIGTQVSIIIPFVQSSSRKSTAFAKQL